MTDEAEERCFDHHPAHESYGHRGALDEQRESSVHQAAVKRTEGAEERPMTLRQQRNALLSANHTLVERLAGMRERLREAEAHWERERDEHRAAEERAEKAERLRDVFADALGELKAAEAMSVGSPDWRGRLDWLETENERLRLIEQTARDLFGCQCSWHMADLHRALGEEAKT